MSTTKRRGTSEDQRVGRGVAAPGGGSLGVLVIEDDPDLQWRLARMLTVQGSRVVGTSSGDGALALVAEWPVDLVLVDDELSGASGIDVARRIREIHPDIPIVLMTAEGGEAVEAAASLAGIVACILKPFEGQALAQLLASLRARAVLAESAT